MGSIIIIIIIIAHAFGFSEVGSNFLKINEINVNFFLISKKKYLLFLRGDLKE